MKKRGKKAKVLAIITAFCFFGFIVMLTEDIAGAMMYLVLTFVFAIWTARTIEKSNGRSLNLGNLILSLKEIFKSKELTDEENNDLKKELSKEIINNNLSLINPLSKLFVDYSNNKKNFIFGTQNGIDENVDLEKLILDFYNDIRNINSLSEMSLIYNEKYFKSKVNKHFRKLIKKMSSNYNNLKTMGLINIDYISYNNLINNTIDIICSNIAEVQNLKLFKAFPIKIDNMQDVNVLYENINVSIKREIIYVFDLLMSVSLMMKLLVANRVKNKINKDSEFYKMLFNVISEFSDIGLIYDKTYELYKEFYLSELDYNFNEFEYAIIIILLVYDIKNIDGKDELDKVIKYKGTVKEINGNFTNLDYNVRKWLDNIATDLKTFDEMDSIIVVISMEFIERNFELLLKSLLSINEWLLYFTTKSDYYRKLKNKERYLKGDFEVERKIMQDQMNYNNIQTGTQFELYLTQLFKDLGYKVKHNGKAGDQGADLILKYEDKTYVVQAKFYDSKLDNTPVQEVIGSIKYYDAQFGVVVTNSTFTQGAEDLAKANRIILIDEKDLKKLIDISFDENKKEDILMGFYK